LSSDTKPNGGDQRLVTWANVWNVIAKGEDNAALRRGLRDTVVMLAMAFVPAMLGSFLAYVSITKSGRPADYVEIAIRASFSGQLFLIFLSIAGTIFSKLWDSDGPRYSFSVHFNLFHLLGVCITSGLIGLDPNMSSFSFLPVGLISSAFFLVGLFHYFIMATTSYLSPPDLQQSTTQRSDKLSANLSDRMNAHGA
jgi:hypothetical protein